MRNSGIICATAAIAAFATCVPAYSSDSAAGQKTFESACASCHKVKSYAGKSDADLETELNGIVGGTIKHPKKLTLNATDIANVAAYISSNEPK